MGAYQRPLPTITVKAYRLLTLEGSFIRIPMKKNPK